MDRDEALKNPIGLVSEIGRSGDRELRPFLKWAVARGRRPGGGAGPSSRERDGGR